MNKCEAELHIADDFGDNHATMRCQRAVGHAGWHREKYKTYGEKLVVVSWEEDDRVKGTGGS